MRLQIYMGLIITCLACFCSASETAKDIDVLVASPDKYRLLLENAEVRVIQYTLQAGEKDNWHTHPAKVSYVLDGGEVKIHTAEGRSFNVVEKTDSASWMGSLGRHYAENTGTTPVRILLVEVKNASRQKEDLKKFGPE